VLGIEADVADREDVTILAALDAADDRAAAVEHIAPEHAALGDALEGWAHSRVERSNTDRGTDWRTDEPESGQCIEIEGQILGLLDSAEFQVTPAVFAEYAHLPFQVVPFLPALPSQVFGEGLGQRENVTLLDTVDDVREQVLPNRRGVVEVVPQGGLGLDGIEAEAMNLGKDMHGGSQQSVEE